MTNELWVRRLNFVVRYLSVFQALFLVVTGITGYFLVTRVKQSLDDQKFLLGISGYISDLKPTLDFECTANVMDDGQIQVAAKVTNVGKNVVVTKTYTRTLISLKDNKQISALSGGDSSTVEFALADFSIDHWTIKIDPGVDPYKTEAHITTTLITDPGVMAIARSVLGERMTPDELKVLGTKTINCLAQPERPLMAPTPVIPSTPPAPSG